MFRKFTDPNRFLENTNSFKMTSSTPATDVTGPQSTVSHPSIGSMPNLTKTTPSSPTSGRSVPTKANPLGTDDPKARIIKAANTTTPSTNTSNSMSEEGIPIQNIMMGFNRDQFPYLQEEHKLNDVFRKVIIEYMDYTDIETNRRLMALDEEEQNTVLLSLTQKFYKMIIGKVDEVDFGEIPHTKGDITKLSKYEEMIKCLDIMNNIFQQYRENPEPVKVINTAIDNIIMHRDLFVASFANKIELGIYMYNTSTLAVINALSYMIAVCIEYVKDPKNDGMKIVMDKTGIGKVKDHLVYENLIKFNDACRKGDLENSLRPLVRTKSKNFVATALLGAKTFLVLSGVLLALLPFLRDIVYFFFATRARVSTYFDVQASLLEMNSEEIKSDPNKSDAEKNRIIRRQLKIAEIFRKISNAVAVEAKVAERQATKEIKDDSKEYKIDDVESNPAPTDGGPLF